MQHLKEIRGMALNVASLVRDRECHFPRFPHPCHPHNQVLTMQFMEAVLLVQQEATLLILPAPHPTSQLTTVPGCQIVANALPATLDTL
jgi:hypothetical protein